MRNTGRNIEKPTIRTQMPGLATIEGGTNFPEMHFKACKLLDQKDSQSSCFSMENIFRRKE